MSDAPIVSHARQLEPDPAGEPADNGTGPTADDSGPTVPRILGLAGWELSKPPRIVGDSLDLYLTHPQRGDVTLTFDTLKDFTNQRHLAAQLALECGRGGKPPTLEKIFTALALASKLAERHRTESEDQIALEWGESFLERTPEHPCDMDDQGARWEAFRQIRAAELAIKDGLRHVLWAGRYSVVLDHALTLRDTPTGKRYVHAGWLFTHTREEGATCSKGAVSQRMKRAGWTRPKNNKRDAREPGGTGRRLWMPAYIVPPGWGDHQDD